VSYPRTKERGDSWTSSSIERIDSHQICRQSVVVVKTRSAPSQRPKNNEGRRSTFPGSIPGQVTKGLPRVISVSCHVLNLMPSFKPLETWMNSMQPSGLRLYGVKKMDIIVVTHWLKADWQTT